MTGQRPARIVDYGTCQPCGKRTYRSRSDAKKAARALPAAGCHLTAYRCRQGTDGWHFGHLPAAVRNGEIAKDDYERRTDAKR